MPADDRIAGLVSTSIDPELLNSTAENLSARADWSAGNRSVEADLRADLFLVLAPFATRVLEIPAIDVRQEGLGLAGRFDSMIGRAVIEYKRPRLLNSEAERERAAEQALGYLEDDQLAAQVVIVTDGCQWGFLRDADAGPELGEQAWFSFLDPDRFKPVDRFVWHMNSTEAARRVLDLLATLRAAPVTPLTVAHRLGTDRTEVREIIARLSHTLRNRKSDERVDVLFRQWIQLAGVAYGISDPAAGYPRSSYQMLGPQLHILLGDLTYAEAIFVLHTYVSLAAKLVACEVLSLVANSLETRPTSWQGLDDGPLVQRITELESGRLTERLRAPSLLAGDVFGWYVTQLTEDEELLSKLRGILRALDGLAWARVANAGGVAVDLLRHLYHGVVPRTMRKALGEFFTPRWLAERVLVRALDLAGNPDNPRILDPSCGSGTFLVAALTWAVAKMSLRDDPGRAEALQEAIDRVIGFDINPVSVLMSRVNLLLALGDRAQELPIIRFSIFQTDSILLPDVTRGQLEIFGAPASFLKVNTAVGPFVLPADLATLQGAALLREVVEQSVSRKRSPELFQTRLSAELRPLRLDRPAEVVGAAVSFYARIRELDAERRNGVWARIVEQALAPTFIQPVDIVVGNPPWISWKNLPSSWKQRSEPVWRDWGLWQTTGQRRGVPLSDISTLLLARSLATYAPKGVIALLLPNSVLIADPAGRSIRQCRLAGPAISAADSSAIQFDPLAVDDFSALNPFSPDASNLPVALYIRGGAVASFPYTQTTWKRQTARTALPPGRSWMSVEKGLVAAESQATPIDATDIGSPWAPITTGALHLLNRSAVRAYAWGRGFETRGVDGLFFCEVMTIRPVGSAQLIRVRNRPDLGKNTRGEDAHEGVVEAQFIWPLVKGEDVGRWFVRQSGLYCIVCHRKDDPENVLSISELAGGAGPNLYDYLEPWIDRLIARSMYRSGARPDRPWGLSGPTMHLRANAHAVLVRYIASRGRPAAAVVSPRYWPALGRETIPLPNNKSNVYFTRDEDEAWYLAGWINSSPAQTELGRFSAATGITPKALEYLPIDKWDRENAEHRLLAMLARQAADAAAPGDGESLLRTEQAIDAQVLAVVRKPRIRTGAS